MTIQIKDLSVSREIDMTAVYGGQVKDSHDTYCEVQASTNAATLEAAAAKGPYQLILAAAYIPIT
jgi:hypothetical protein